MSHREELDFQKDFIGLIKSFGGRADLIECRKSPGNSDILYSLDSERGLLELKRSVHFKMSNKIRLVHPLKANQRSFLSEHGTAGSWAGGCLVAVLFSKNDNKRDYAAIWTYQMYLMAERMSLEDALACAKWQGDWPPRGPSSDIRVRMLRDALRS